MYYATTAELQQRDAFVARQRQMQEQAAANERAYRSNVNRFVEMYLTLGSDVIKIADGSRHDAELAEAKGLAASRWPLFLVTPSCFSQESSG